VCVVCVWCVVVWCVCVCVCGVCVCVVCVCVCVCVHGFVCLIKQDSIYIYTKFYLNHF